MDVCASAGSRRLCRAKARVRALTASHRRRRCARQRGEQIARLIRSGFRVPRIPCEAIFLVYVVGVAVTRSLRVGAALRCHSICFVSEALTASYRRCRRAMHRSKKNRALDSQRIPSPSASLSGDYQCGGSGATSFVAKPPAMFGTNRPRFVSKYLLGALPI